MSEIAQNTDGSSNSMPAKCNFATMSRQDVDNLLQRPVDPYCSSQEKRSASDIEKLATSIKDEGQLRPVVIVGGQIFDGRHRLEAIKKLKDAKQHDGMVDCEEYDASSRDVAVKRVTEEILLARQMGTTEKAIWAVRYKEALEAAKLDAPTDKELATLLKISERTIEFHRRKLKNKLPAKTKEELPCIDEMRERLKEVPSYIKKKIESSSDEETRRLYKILKSIIHQREKENTVDAESVRKVPDEAEPTKGSKRNRKTDKRPPVNYPQIIRNRIRLAIRE